MTIAVRAGSSRRRDWVDFIKLNWVAVGDTGVLLAGFQGAHKLRGDQTGSTVERLQVIEVVLDRLSGPGWIVSRDRVVD